MGMIVIQVMGSFGIVNQTKRFEARTYGHAHAVTDALKFLSGEVLAHAINLDHELQRKGRTPLHSFKKI